jgi:DNA-binding Lrp family transcriptional regulator
MSTIDDRTREFLDDVQTALVEGPEIAAQRLGATPSALAKRLYRLGRPDLAKPFGRLQRKLARA